MSEHLSDCAVYNEPAMSRGPCNCLEIRLRLASENKALDVGTAWNLFGTAADELCRLGIDLKETTEQRDRLRVLNAKLVAALEEMLLEYRAFRAKPHGAPNSAARITQDRRIELEEQAHAALAMAKGETP